MQNEQQLCQIYDHEGCKSTHICIFGHCSKSSRYMCNKCINDGIHIHGYYFEHDQYYPNSRVIEIENFMEHFKDHELPLIERRLKTQNGNHIKLKYLKKIYEDYFDDLGWFNDKVKVQKEILENIKYIIQNLLNAYNDEIVKAQQITDTNSQITKNGLQSLSTKELDILLSIQNKFINDEIEYYNQINMEINKLDLECYQFELGIIQKKLRRINDYLDFQKYSTNGQEALLDREEFMNTSFFSENCRFFAMINCDYQENNNNKLKIRRQKNLDISQQFNCSRRIKNIKFDPLFNYFILQEYNQFDFYFYTRRNTKQFKFIRKFSLNQSIVDFFLSNLNNIIIFFDDSIVIKTLNFKNEYVNEIKWQKVQIMGMGNFYYFCYGRERNVIATYNQQQVQIYYENQQQPLLSSFVEQVFIIKFINHDQQIFTKDRDYWTLWQIDYHNLKIAQINVISLEYFDKHIYISEFNIIKTTLRDGDIRDHQNIEILDTKLNQIVQICGKGKKFQLTKRILVLSNKNCSQIIKRRQITEYDTLGYDY